MVRSKVKRIAPFFLSICLSFLPTWGFSQQKSTQIDSLSSNRYSHYPVCIQKVYLQSDEVRELKGPWGEIEFLKQNLEVCEENSSITRRLALKYLEMGDTMYDAIGSEVEHDKKDLFENGLKWSRIALEQDTTDHYNYETMSMAFAAMITVSRLKGKANLADSVRIYAEECVRLNPKNDRAYHILGRWHYEVSKLSWFVKLAAKVLFRRPQDGSFELAVTYFQKAISIENIPSHRYWLALAYLEKGDTELALNHFETLLTLPNVQHNDQFFKEKAREILASYE